jgi:hypothetical protein
MRNSAGLRNAAGRIASVAQALALIDAYRQSVDAGLGIVEALPIISTEPCRPQRPSPAG